MFFNLILYAPRKSVFYLLLLRPVALNVANIFLYTSMEAFTNLHDFSKICWYFQAQILLI
jgi:hypothetical protein